MSAEKYLVFISYARRDGKQLAYRLRETFEENGIRPWLDTREIEGGASWTLEIKEPLILQTQSSRF
jgi:hypothetical protein